MKFDEIKFSLIKRLVQKREAGFYTTDISDNSEMLEAHGIDRYNPGNYHSVVGALLSKKKDELGLTNRRMGTTYSNIQRMIIIAEVERFKAEGITKFDSLKALGVCRSTFYGWLQPQKAGFRKSSIMRLTDTECKAIIQ